MFLELEDIIKGLSACIYNIMHDQEIKHKQEVADYKMIINWRDKEIERLEQLLQKRNSSL